MENTRLRPFRFWCHKILPLVYDNSLSYYELLCKVVSYLNSTIEATNEMKETVEELYQFVQTYFDSDAIQNMIDEKLDSMAEDGTLSELLIQQIHGKEITLNKIGRLLWDSTEDNVNYIIGGQSVFYKDNIWYETGNVASGTVGVNVYNAQGVNLNSNTYTEGLTHSNDITGDDEFLYVATYAGNVIYCLDYTTLEIVNTITIPNVDNVCGCSYDEDSKSLWIYCRNTGSSFIEFFELKDGINVNSITIPYIESTVPQGMLSYKDSLYLCFVEPNVIYRISKEEKRVTMVYSIPDGDGLYPIGEPESLLIYNNTICVSGCVYFDRLYSGLEHPQATVPIFETDINKTILPNVQPYSYMHKNQVFKLILDSNMQYTFNPKLTVSTAVEACMIANYIGHCYLTLGTINAGNILQFVESKVVIYNYSAIQNLYGLECINADVTIRGCNIEKLYCDGSTLNAVLGPLAITECDFISSDVKLINALLKGCTRFNCRFSQIELDGFKGISNDCLLEGTDKPNNITIKSRYMSNILYLTHYNLRSIVTMTTNNGIDVSFVMQEPPSEDTMDTYSISDQSNAYSTIGYEQSSDGTFYLTPTGGSATAINVYTQPMFTVIGFRE